MEFIILLHFNFNQSFFNMNILRKSGKNYKKEKENLTSIFRRY